MKRSGVALIEEIVAKFRPLAAADRERYALRLGALVGKEMVCWLLPVLMHPPGQSELEELKQALAAHAKFEAALAEFRDAACPGVRALGLLCLWATASREGEPEEEEEEPDADDTD